MPVIKDWVAIAAGGACIWLAFNTTQFYAWWGGVRLNHPVSRRLGMAVFLVTGGILLLVGVARLVIDLRPT